MPVGCESVARGQVTTERPHRIRINLVFPEGRFCAIFHNHHYATKECKRKVQMTPLCKVEMALLGFRNREMHQLRHEAADRKEGRSPPLPALHFVT